MRLLPSDLKYLLPTEHGYVVRDNISEEKKEEFRLLNLEYKRLYSKDLIEIE